MPRGEGARQLPAAARLRIRRREDRPRKRLVRPCRHPGATRGEGLLMKKLMSSRCSAGGLAASLALFLACGPSHAVDSKDEIARGRYLIQTAGCNDCHTPGYGPNEGRVDEK